MDDEKVRLFISCLKHGSLRRAAKENYMSEPALNNKLRSLERELGVTLIQRTPRGITLTSEGKVLAALAPRLLGVSQDIRSAMDPVQATNELFIAATPDLASLLLPQFLAYLSTNFLQNATGVVVCHPPEMIQGLQSGRFNVGLLHTVDQIPNLSHRLLIEERLTFISGERLDPISIEEIQMWELFAPVKEYLAWQLIESLFNKHDVWPKAIVHVNHPLLVAQIVGCQIGMRGIVSEGSLSSSQSKRLKPPFPVQITDAELPLLPTYVIWKNKNHSQDVARFLDLLVDFISHRRKRVH